MTDKELNDMVYSDNPWERRTAAMNGYGLDVLINDDDDDVRRAVARTGYKTWELLRDYDSEVRLIAWIYFWKRAKFNQAG